MISYNLYKYAKTSVVGHFAYKDVPIPEIGEFVDLKPIEDKYENHIGVFNMNGQQIGSVVSKLKAGDIKRNCENNHSLIADVKNCNRMHFEVVEIVPYNSDVIIVIEGAFFGDEPEQESTPEPERDFLGRISNPEEIAGPISYNQFIGDKAIKVELVGVVNTDKLDDNGKPIKAWTWLDEADRVHKRGPATKALNRAIAEAKCNSGDIVGIMFKKGWIVKKL